MRRRFSRDVLRKFGFERRMLCNHTFFPSRVHAVSFPRFAFPPGSSPFFLYLPVPLFLFPHHLFSVRPRQPFTSARLRLLFPPPLFLLPARSTLPPSLSSLLSQPLFLSATRDGFPSPSSLPTTSSAFYRFSLSFFFSPIEFFFLHFSFLTDNRIQS